MNRAKKNVRRLNSQDYNFDVISPAGCDTEKPFLVFNLKVLNESKIDKEVKEKIKSIWVDRYLDTNRRYMMNSTPKLKKKLIKEIDEEARQSDYGCILNYEKNKVYERALLNLMTYGDDNDRIIAIKAAKFCDLSVRVPIVEDACRFRGKGITNYACRLLGIRLNEGEVC